MMPLRLQMTPIELAFRLSCLPAAHVPAVRLVLDLQDETDPEVVAERREEIEDAISQLEKQLSHTRGIVSRCQNLQPVPARRVPAGF